MKKNLNIFRKEAMPFVHKYYVEKHKNGDSGVGIYKDDKEVPKGSKTGKLLALTNKGREKKMWKLLGEKTPRGEWKQAEFFNLEELRSIPLPKDKILTFGELNKKATMQGLISAGSSLKGYFSKGVGTMKNKIIHNRGAVGTIGRGTMRMEKEIGTQFPKSNRVANAFMHPANPLPTELPGLAIKGGLAANVALQRGMVKSPRLFNAVDKTNKFMLNHFPK